MRDAFWVTFYGVEDHRLKTHQDTRPEEREVSPIPTLTLQWKGRKVKISICPPQSHKG